MKKLLLLITLLSLLSLAVFVMAIQEETTIPQEKKITLIPDINPKTESFITINKGWNLIYGLYNPNQLQDNGEISSKNIKAIYAFIPQTQKYVRVYPASGTENLREQENLRNVVENIGLENTADVENKLRNLPFWVYSDKSSSSEYWLQEPLPITDFQLYAGWNFIGVTPELFGKSLSELKGDCNILRSYIWWNKGNKWDTIPLDGPFTEELVLKGMVIKVNENCRLSESVSSLNPPVMPENAGENSKWNKYIYEGDISDFKYKRSSTREGNCYLTNSGDNCIFYKGTYDLNGGGIDVVDVTIEVPSSHFELTEEILSLIDTELSDGQEYSSDDEYFNNNFIWAGVKQNKDSLDINYLWENDGKLFLITFDDVEKDFVGDNLFNKILDKYISRYPSSIQR